jgi:hypothetical protein
MLELVRVFNSYWKIPLLKASYAILSGGLFDEEILTKWVEGRWIPPAFLSGCLSKR